jgi:hypothetical protein
LLILKQLTNKTTKIKNMQHNKNTNNVSDLEIVLSDPKKLTSSLTDAMEKFNVKK